ncbi:ATP-binding cassette domain-containing protein [Luethyella okanaganae]|uniref:ATP-binding cassette domain-containing protein n=1 Tax=Luethyella okanaganae TaxID=69372 RepID=A0ABW1VHJ0_9MICO
MAIQIRDVTFGYSLKHPVFERLSIDLESFPAVVLGPNGAGKSTLLGLIVGHLKPKLGSISVGGHARGKDPRRSRRTTGWLPQDVKPLSGFTARQQVAYAGWLKGLKYSAAWTSAAEALESVSLSDHAAQSASKLSGGQRRRLGVAQALVHDPSFLILDEPYAGLDPEQRSSVRDTLLAVSAKTSLVVSTHQTEDLEDVYAHVLVIEGGRVIFSGSTAKFYEGVPESVAPAGRAEAAYRQILERSRSSEPS